VPTKSKCSHACYGPSRGVLTCMPVTSPDKCRVGLVLVNVDQTDVSVH